MHHHLRRIVWSEGMLMSPQHMQQHDLYLEALVHRRLGAVVPFCWGAVELDLDVASLDSGQVLLRTFSGVMRDGTYIAFRDGDPAAPPARAIGSHFTPTQPSLPVYLALPRERAHGVNYAEAEDQGTRTRFVIRDEPVHDVVHGTGEVGVEFAQPNLCLLFGNEELDDHDVLPVAELIRDSTGAYAFSPTFVPPLLRVGACPFLMDGCRRLLSMATAKQRELSAQRSIREGSAAEYNAADVTRFLLLNALSTSIPVLKHIVDSGDLGPHEVYLLLLQMAGQLCTFTADVQPDDLPSYQHGELRDTFEPLFARLTSLMRATVAGRHLAIPLEARADGMHLAKLTNEELFRGHVTFILSVESELPDAKVGELVPRVAKVGAWGQIPQIVSASMPGVELRRELRPPKEIPIRPGRSYFSVGVEQHHWKLVLQERTIAVHLPPPFTAENAKVELLAIPPQG